MVQVNLLSKRKGFGKQKSLYNIVGLSLFSLLALYFLFQVGSLLYRYVRVNQRLARVRDETRAVSTEILQENVQLNRFIATKFILREILTLRSRQFDYPGHLEQVQSTIPANTDLTGVDFSIPGFVSIRTVSPNSNLFADFESSLKEADLADTNFSSVVVKSVARDSEGLYRTDLLYGIRNDGRQ